MAEPRPVRFTLRMSEAERKMLDDLATETGIDASDVIRMLIRQEHEKKHPKP